MDIVWPQLAEFENQLRLHGQILQSEPTRLGNELSMETKWGRRINWARRTNELGEPIEFGNKLCSRTNWNWGRIERGLLWESIELDQLRAKVNFCRILEFNFLYFYIEYRFININLWSSILVKSCHSLKHFKKRPKIHTLYGQICVVRSTFSITFF